MSRPRASSPRAAFAARRDSDLTDEEQAHVRAVLRFLRRRCNGHEGVAKALRFNATHISEAMSGKCPVTASMAFRVARLAKVSVDDVITGKYPVPGTCPLCGHVGPVEEIGEP